MTWILADERTVVRANSTDTADMEAWLDWFYLTYLPTRGYTTTKGNSGADIYYGTRQSWVTKIGAVMQTSQVHEFELPSNDVVTYAWDTNETDPTVGISSKTDTTSSPLLINYGTNLLAFSLPHSGANNDTLAAPEYWEGWFCSTLTGTGNRYLQPTGRFGNVTGFVTNLVDITSSPSYATYHTHHYASDDIFTKFNRGSNVNYSSPFIFDELSSCEAIQIAGGTDFYLDLNGGSTVSILLKTGAVNPEA